MNLAEAIRSGTRLVVAVQPDYERLAAEVYIVKGGVAFLDVGWSEVPYASSFRAHFMAGRVEGQGPWHVGEWVIRELDPARDQGHMLEWRRWERYKQETNATRKRGAEYASQHLGIAVSP